MIDGQQQLLEELEILIRYYHEKAELHSYSGSTGSYFQNVWNTLDDVRYRIEQGKWNPENIEIIKHIKLEQDPEYQEYLRLRKKFEGSK